MTATDLQRVKARSRLTDPTFSRVLTGGGTERSIKAVKEAAAELGVKFPRGFFADDSRKPPGAE